MRGSVVKKGDRWYVKIELDVDPATGRRRQKWHSGYKNKREAERARVDLLSKLDRGEYVEPSHQSARRVPQRVARRDRANSSPVDVRLVLEEHAPPCDRAHRHGAARRRLTPACSMVSTQRCCPRVGVVRRGRAAATPRLSSSVPSSFAPRGTPSRRRPNSFVTRCRKPITSRRTRLPRSFAAPPTGQSTSVRRRSRSRSPNGQLHPHDPAPRLQGRGPLGSPAAQPRRRRGSAAGRAEVRRRARLGRGNSPPVPRRVPQPPRTGTTRSGFCSQPPGCGEAKRSDFGGATSTSTRAGCRIVQTIIQTRNVVSVGEPKTARGRRPISLDAATIAVLRAHRHRMLQERLLVGPDFDDLGLVFHQPDGSWLRPDAVSEVFLRRVRRYGLPR